MLLCDHVIKAELVSTVGQHHSCVLQTRQHKNRGFHLLIHRFEEEERRKILAPKHSQLWKSALLWANRQAKKGSMTCLSSQNAFLTITFLHDTLEIKPDRWNVFSSQKRQALDSCVKTGFPCTAPLKQPSVIKRTSISASRCKVISGLWRVENKNLNHPVYVLTSEMRKVTQLLLMSCSVSCKSLHLGVSSLNNFNWCLGVFMAAEDLQAKGLVLIHQQGIQSEEPWVQRETNWAGRSLSDEPWVGMTGGLVIADSLGECVCVNRTQTLAQPSIPTGHRVKLQQAVLFAILEIVIFWGASSPFT